jgi:hypothetical protein
MSAIFRQVFDRENTALADHVKDVQLHSTADVKIA